MGTNYYVHIKLSESEKERLKRLIDEDNISELKYSLPEYEIHIGKSSGGWQFLFNHNNNEYYERTRESIDSFIRDEDHIFMDEYGDLMDPDEFWEKVDSKKDLWDHKAYNEAIKRGEVHGVSEYHISIHDMRTHDFHENGLRFSDSTEFS